jgi:hypothetical protein
MSGPLETPYFRAIQESAVWRILGMERHLPLTPEEMAASLRVTFFPVPSATERVRAFAARLRDALRDAGVTIVEYQEALTDPVRGKVRERYVVIAPGDMETGDLPVDHVTNLRTATIVGIEDGPCPADTVPGLQEKLNSVVRKLAWNIVQVMLFVSDDSWTVATMNGAIVKFSYDDPFERIVRQVLIPKLAAPVVPPHASDFEVRDGELDLHRNGFVRFARDFSESGRTWAETGLMLFHTSLDSLEFRSRYYQRIAAAYLDHRSGMSYGFLARQLPVQIEPAALLDGPGTGADGAPGGSEVVTIAGQSYLVRVPEVWVLTTRSGCDKSNVDVDRDIVLMGLVNGSVVFETPRGTDMRVDCRPSYDTLTIMAHAVGNAIVACVLARVRPDAPFVAMMREGGAALAHWHGLINPAILPRGYFVHGTSNPPVSCSTFQSAVYALTGKLGALEQSLREGVPFLGDVHVEPFHGTNITGASLVSLAGWIRSNLATHGITQFTVQTPGHESVEAGTTDH